MQGMGGMIQGWAGGATAHTAEAIGQLGPAAKAQRQEFRKAKTRLKTNQYGYSAAQSQQAQAQGNREIQAQAQQQQSDIARMQAAGMLAGGAATEAQRAVAQQQAAGAAAVANSVQQASNANAMQQYGMDQARVDAQAQRWREFNTRQGDISMATTQGTKMPDSFGQQSDKKKFPEQAVGGQPGPSTTLPV